MGTCDTTLRTDYGMDCFKTSRHVWCRTEVIGLFSYVEQVGHQHEVWCFDVNPTETRLIAGSTDSFLRVWTLQMPGSNVDNNGIESIQPNKSRKLVHQANPSSIQQSDSSVDLAYATYYGTLSRTGTSTTTSTTSTARVTHVLHIKLLV